MERTGSARVLLGIASALAVAGGALHASVFGRAAALLTASNLPLLLAHSAEGLWLSDSATLILTAVLFFALAVRPASAQREIVFLIALIPGATAVMIYLFLGAFFAGHLLLLIALLGIAASALWPVKVPSAAGVQELIRK